MYDVPYGKEYDRGAGKIAEDRSPRSHLRGLGWQTCVLSLYAVWCMGWCRGRCTG